MGWAVAYQASAVHGILQAETLQWAAIPSHDSLYFQRGIESGFPLPLRADSLPSEGSVRKPWHIYTHTCSHSVVSLVPISHSDDAG